MCNVGALRRCRGTQPTLVLDYECDHKLGVETVWSGR
jgi:hypothetical protein